MTNVRSQDNITVTLCYASKVENILTHELAIISHSESTKYETYFSTLFYKPFYISLCLYVSQFTERTIS